MKVIGKRIKWIKALYCLCFLMFLGVGVWLLFSLKASTSIDPLLLAMSILVLALALLFLALAILSLIKKTNAVILEGSSLTIYERGKRTIALKEIKEAKYRLFGNSGKFGSAYNSGTLFLYFNDGTSLKVSEIKNVKSVCGKVNKLISKLD